MMSELGEWQTNDPADPRAPRFPLENENRTQAEELADYLRWRAQLIEGPPYARAGSGVTVEQLRAMGLVGLYRPDSRTTKG